MLDVSYPKRNPPTHGVRPGTSRSSSGCAHPARPVGCGRTAARPSSPTPSAASYLRLLSWPRGYPRRRSANAHFTRRWQQQDCFAQRAGAIAGRGSGEPVKQMSLAAASSRPGRQGWPVLPAAAGGADAADPPAAGSLADARPASKTPNRVSADAASNAAPDRRRPPGGREPELRQQGPPRSGPPRPSSGFRADRHGTAPRYRRDGARAGASRLALP